MFIQNFDLGENTENNIVGLWKKHSNVIISLIRVSDLLLVGVETMEVCDQQMSLLRNEGEKIE